jgi:hypothetical protein
VSNEKGIACCHALPFPPILPYIQEAGAPMSRYYNCGIRELDQTGENSWKATYQGNYGVYTIKITTDGTKTVKYSCTCPSDASRCKHISMVEEAIADQISINKKKNKNSAPDIGELIKAASVEELRGFILAQAKYNSEFSDAILLEFVPRMKNRKDTAYGDIIRKGLACVDFYDEDYDYYSGTVEDIDILDQWIQKARDCVAQEQYREAILICKACIEEYAKWYYENVDESEYWVDESYQSNPFEILAEAVQQDDKQELFDYCISEMKKEKYDSSFQDCFHQLLENLSLTLDPGAFLALQDGLLSGIEDKASGAARKILQRKIDFLRKLSREDEAWAIIEDSIQIDDFREELVKKRIDEGNLLGAKKLINDFLVQKQPDSRTQQKWNYLLLTIAEKGNDIPAIRTLSYGFIKDCFKNNHYNTYISTFPPEERIDELENLFQHYDNKKYFSSSAADLLKAENDSGRMILYIEKYLSIEHLMDYYSIFSSAYPEKTLKLFRKVLDTYAEEHTGRSHYTLILTVLREMSSIEGGEKAAADIAETLKGRYKGRKAMIEILNRL